ncbi:MAG: acetoacetyl-CoA synthetase [Actinomycetota bacterium]|nr:acetoacetyl-CoA synthetase [Actinomycetota bacterium]
MLSRLFQVTSPPLESDDVLWSPPADVRQHSRIGRYLRWLEEHRGLRFAGYHDLWEWSVTDLDAFWTTIWEYFEVGPPVTAASAPAPAPALADRAMPGARWFPTARLNYAAQMLRGAGGGLQETPGNVAVLARSQTRGPVDLTAGELRRQVARARAGLARLGVGSGDRVVAYLPNIPETLVAFLATASLGAVWASCAPEFGTRSVLDRFSQIDPKVLLAIDGYRYGAKPVDRTAEVAAIRRGLPGLAATVAVPYLDADGGAAALPGAVPWAGLLAAEGPLEFEPVPFDHPLYVLYSSGTTGLPKPIVHGHGGILLEHMKQLAFSMDLGPGDRFFWFSTTGWMMWNLLVSGLAVGSALVLFDGDLASPDLTTLWRLAEETETTVFGVSAPFLLACRKAGLEPAKTSNLSRIRGVGSTGAPLPPEGFRWVYEAVSTDALLNSTSGGTDICSAFVGACPLLAVREGRISGRALGAKVEAFDPDGRPVVGEQGELVITEPMPSMPVGFWGDTDGSRYRSAYFDEFPGVWRHGDWIAFDDDGSCVISGRSDSTLNRGGVRLGTSEFYSVVDGFAEVADSLVVHIEDRAGEGIGMGELLLFVVPADGVEVDAGLKSRIAGELRRSLSPRHVPDAIHGVQGIPRTLSGKKLEVPVKRILTGTPTDVAASRGALANPDSLDAFERLAAERATP